MKSIFMALSLMLLVSCSSNSQEVNKTGNFGDEITAEGAVSPAELAKSIEGKEEVESIKVRGEVTSVCKKKGCWMKMDLGDGTQMRVTFKDYGFFVPLDCDGKLAVIQGKAYMQETPVDELKHYAEDAGKTEEEIAAITEPKRELTFEATVCYHRIVFLR